MSESAVRRRSVPYCGECAGLTGNAARGSGVRGGMRIDNHKRPLEYKDRCQYPTGEMFDENDYEYLQEVFETNDRTDTDKRLDEIRDDSPSVAQAE